MKKYFKIIFIIIGLDPRRLLNTFRFGWRYLREYYSFTRAKHKSQHRFGELSINPRLNEFVSNSAKPTKHYFVQDNFVADFLSEIRPISLLDIGSRVDGYINQIRHICPVTVLDIRHPNYELKNVNHVIGDLMDENSIKRLLKNNDYPIISCLHTIEHIGLGRYGDKIDVNGDSISLSNLFMNMSSGAQLILSVPFSDKPRVEFNAQRVYDLSALRATLPLSACIEEQWLIDDDDCFVDPTKDRSDINFGVIILLLRKG